MGDGVWFCCLEFVVVVFLEDIVRDVMFCVVVFIVVVFLVIDVYFFILIVIG